MTLTIRDRLPDATAVTPELVREIIGKAALRSPSKGQAGKSARIERLMAAGAWTDAALALIELELPQWQLRRIAYDGGEWHCELSRARELPDWLDQSVEARHPDLALALLGAFAEAQRDAAPRTTTSVPLAPRNADEVFMPVCCDNFA
jgi:hypothetical protein